MFPNRNQNAIDRADEPENEHGQEISEFIQPIISERMGADGRAQSEEHSAEDFSWDQVAVFSSEAQADQVVDAKKRGCRAAGEDEIRRDETNDEREIDCGSEGKDDGESSGVFSGETMPFGGQIIGFCPMHIHQAVGKVDAPSAEAEHEVNGEREFDPEACGENPLPTYGNGWRVKTDQVGPQPRSSNPVLGKAGYSHQESEVRFLQESGKLRLGKNRYS